jgi:hypothetical protein
MGQAALLRLGAELRRAASISVDAKFLALMAATPGITSPANTGVTASAVLADLTARLNALTIGADSKLWWIVSPKLFKTLSLLQGTGGYLMQGGKIGDINVAASDAATTTATLLDARQVAAGQCARRFVAIGRRPNLESSAACKSVPKQPDRLAMRGQIWRGRIGLKLCHAVDRL